MIKIVIAYDDNDSDLGDYFEESYNNLLQGIQAANETPSSVLRGLQCNEANINTSVTALYKSSFVFVGLSHGNKHCLRIDSTGEIFVSQNNSMNFRNSFFYTTACKAGLDLRKTLMENGCKGFIGYIKNSKAPLNESYNSLFIECELYALKQFFLTDKTIFDLYNEMLVYTQSKIDWLFEKDEVVEAMDLQSNKDCLKLFGDEKLIRQSFQLA